MDTATRTGNSSLQELESSFMRQLQDAIAKDQLTLPTLPEVAVHIQKAVEDPNLTLEYLTKILSNDTAISARIIKIANSPLAQNGPPVDSLSHAIQRLGLNFVRNLTTGFAMEQIFQATHEYVDKRMHQVWEHSLEVAAIASTLAKHHSKLSIDEVALGGLVHEIGILPVLTFAEEYSEILEDRENFERLLVKIHPVIGVMILEKWNFPSEIINIPRHYLDFNRKSPGEEPDYADIITIANLQCYRGSDHPYARMNWHSIPAFKKLGVDPQKELSELQPLYQDLQKVKKMMW